MMTFDRQGMSGADFNRRHGDCRYTLLADLKPNLINNEIVRGLLPKKGLGEVHADSGGGKTAIIVDLLLHVAAGLQYGNRRTEQQPVVHVALEGHAGIDNRVLAAAAEIGITEAPFALIKSSDSFRNEETAEKVARVAQDLLDQFGGDCPIVSIDTYTAALGAGGSDCAPEDVTAFIANIQKHLLNKCTVLILHHFGKDQSRGGRGWSGLRAALDFELEIDHDGDGLRTMRVTKARDGSDQQPAFCYRFHGHKLGVNTYGEDVTAVVVEHLADEDSARRGRKITPKARAALNVLWAIIKGEKGQAWPMVDQPGMKCTMVSIWETECIAPGAICKAAEEKERRRKFKDAQSELVEQGLVTCDGQRVYPTPKGEKG